MNEKIQAKIDLLSTKPGVYLMKNADGVIIYVGKAKSLIKRVKQYFTRPQEGKVLRMVREIDDFDTIETLSEKEALLLEINLIRKYYPKFNILLKDGKSYPYIALKKAQDPFLKIAYQDKDPHYKYFGPYPSGSSCYQIMDLLNKLFPLRKCKNLPSSPCLYYHIGQCLGPCINKIDDSVYQPLVEQIVAFLNGDNHEIKEKLKKEMNEKSAALEFEKASEIKNLLESIDKVCAKQNIQLQDHTNRDVIASSARDGYFCLIIISYRNGIMLGKNEFVLEIFDDMEEEIIDHVFTYYMKHDLPQEIITSSKKIQEELSFLLDIKVVVPTLGSKKEMLLIALENAKKGLDEHFLTSRLEDDVLSTLEELGKLLKIKTPLRIELFDNSHLQGSFPVGAMVCFINGNKAPGEYRKFNINNSSGQDDLKSMEEVITRRYSRLLNENKTFPDLIIVDGGATQINVAQEVLDNLGLEIPLCGLAKDNHHHTNGLVYHGEEYFLDRKSKLFLLLVRMQDEVHRFALSTHVNKRSKNLTSTFYDEIPGIGKKRKEMLLKAYPTLNDILKASVAEIAQIVPEAVAKNIVNYLNSKEVTHESKDD